MATIGELNVRIGAEISDFEAKMAKVQSGFGQLGNFAKSAGQSLSTFITLPLTVLAGAAIKTAADLGALEQGFAATYKGAEPLSVALKKVTELAKLPGLGLREALQGATNLQAAGFSADVATKALGAFGNALATVGKGKAELDRVTLALTQINNTPFVQGQDLNQLRQALPQIGEALKSAFGTTSAEGLKQLGITSKQFITGITAEFAKLPQIGNTLKNSLENLSDAGTKALRTLGDSLNNAFNLTDLVNRVSAGFGDVAASFASLSPAVQKAVFLFAGLAAAVGPLLVVIGTIGAAIGPLTLGFAALSGPVALAGIAIAALVAAGIAFAATSKGSSQVYDEQKSKVQALTSTLNPLLARYDELRAKASLNKTEQAELAKVVNEVADKVPGAATAFDSYGNALAINSGKAREFVLEQQAMLRALNSDKISEQNGKLRELATQIIKTTQLLQAGRLTDNTGESQSFVRGLTGEEVSTARSQLKSLNQQFDDGNALLRSYKGEVLATATAITALGGAADPNAKAMAKALAEVAKSLRDVVRENQALGDVYDLIDGKQSALESGIKKLVDAGFSPFSREVRGLVLQLQQVPGLLGAIAQISGNTEIGVKLKPAELPTGLALSKKTDKEDPYFKLLTDKEERTALFTQRINGLFGQMGEGLATASVGIAGSLGEALGNILVNGASIGDGLSGIFSGVLSALADFMGNFGKQLITIGIGKVALDTLFTAPGTGPLAIAAGVGLVALAGIASAVAKNAAGSISGISSGGGAGGGSGLASSPRTSFTPTAQPVISGPPSKIIHEIIVKQRGADLIGVLQLANDRRGRVV